MKVECEDEVGEYYKIRKELEFLGVQFRIYITKSQYLIPFLQPGRLLKVSNDQITYIHFFKFKVLSVILLQIV